MCALVGNFGEKKLPQLALSLPTLDMDRADDGCRFCSGLQSMILIGLKGWLMDHGWTSHGQIWFPIP